MARENILIADGDLGVLRLVSAVLSREGYRVFIAPTAEQALSVMRSNRLDLILAGADFPGMGAADLMANVTEDAGGSAIAAELVKPVDPLELPHTNRHILESPPPKKPAPAAPLAGPAADDFRRSFLADGARQSRAMLTGLGSAFDPVRACQTVQEWAGTARTLGLDDIAVQARPAAQALKFYPTQWPKLQGPITSLMEAFERAMAGGEVRLAGETARILRGAKIAVIGFPPVEVDRFCDALARGGAFVRLFGADEPVDSETARACALCLVHVRPETLGSPWMRPAQSPLGQVVAVGRIEHLAGMDAAVRMGIRELLVSGLRPEEVWLRLARVLAAMEAQPGEHRPAARMEGPPKESRKSNEVLVVDDDPNVRALVRATLENHGIRVRVASTAEEGIALAREFAPAAALVDVNMPGMSGFEAVPHILAESPKTKVVMLTAREQEDDILRGFALGSEDYVVKPFIPKELVARVRRLL